MAGIANEESGVGKAAEGSSTGQRCQSGEALTEWRSSEQVENGTPSTSPPYWDTDEDDDVGAKPSELYGKYTWKIEKFSQITKRELRSNAFEVGGYKWYVLIYPQGCDVCDHLSLFLCVANHDKLLPGWSHFAQFTIAVVNKDPKKSKYSDTLHRFWKKEHDWGWKKFMELSKVYQGFVDASDNLIIKTQVQVVREKADGPFRCLDCQYRRELIRVYLTNVEQIFRRFVEERRSKLGKLIEDKARWTSFCDFWLGIEQNSRRCMSREKTDVILKLVVKHFFLEKDVNSTLVIDSLRCGLRALESQSKCKKGRVKALDAEEMPAPLVCVEKDIFVLVDDILMLLERAAVEPLPPKDEKGPQNRTKDGSSGEDFYRDSIWRDERRLTELGRRTMEIFILAHIFSTKIEVAYQEAVALKRQEELIREEEEAWLAEIEQKAKRANEKEKKSKKKQAKQKKNNRKVKDKGRDERPMVVEHDKHQEDNPADEEKNSNMEEVQTVAEKPDASEDVSDDVSDSLDGAVEVPQPDSEDREASPVNWDTDASEVHHPTEARSNGISDFSPAQNDNEMAEKRSSSLVDDSSSTCSSDSLPSMTTNGPFKRNSYPNNKVQQSPSRSKNPGKASNDGSRWNNEVDSLPSRSATDVGDANGESTVITLQDRLKWLEKPLVKKEVEVLQLEKKLSINDEPDRARPVDAKSLLKERTSVPAVPSSPRSPPTCPPSSSSTNVDPVHIRKTSSTGSHPIDVSSSTTSPSPVTVVSQSRSTIPKTPERYVAQLPVVSRPSSTPLVPGPRPISAVVSMVQTAPLLARSMSASGRLGPDPSPATHSYAPQSYRNAMMGNSATSTASSFTPSNASSSGVNLLPTYSQPPSMVSSPMYLSKTSDRLDSNSSSSGHPYGMMGQDVLQNGSQWVENLKRDVNRGMRYDATSVYNDIQNIDMFKPVHSRSISSMPTEFPASTSGRHSQGLLADEFPHLDIINDLLDDEHVVGKSSPFFQSLNNGPHSLNRQFTSPGDLGTCDDDTKSSTSSCRFERSRSYHDYGFHRGYSSSSMHFDSIRDYVPQGSSTLPYLNGHVDGLIQNQWQVANSDLSPYLGSLRHTENDGYPYYPDYSSMACGANVYTVYRPSNNGR